MRIILQKLFDKMFVIGCPLSKDSFEYSLLNQVSIYAFLKKMDQCSCNYNLISISDL